MAAGLKASAVASRELRSAEEEDRLVPGTQVDFFQDLSANICLPGTLLARSQETRFRVIQRLPAPRLAFTNDAGNVCPWVPGLLDLRVPQHRFRKTERFARGVVILQQSIHIDGFGFDCRVIRAVPGFVELLSCLRKGSMGSRWHDFAVGVHVEFRSACSRSGRGGLLCWEAAGIEGRGSGLGAGDLQAARRPRDQDTAGSSPGSQHTCSPASA